MASCRCTDSCAGSSTTADWPMDTTGNPLDPDPVARHAALTELRAAGSVVPIAGLDGVMAAVRFDSVGGGLRRVEEFGGSAAQDGLPEPDTNIAGIREPRHGQLRRIINSVVAFHKSQ